MKQALCELSCMIWRVTIYAQIFVVCYFLFFMGDIKITKIYILKSFLCVSHKQQIVMMGLLKYIVRCVAIASYLKLPQLE